MAEENIETAKIKRRNGKAALTRLGKTTNLKVAGNRSAEEIRKFLDLYEKEFLDLTAKHEQLTLLIEEDGQFEEEESWFEAVQDTFLRLKIDTEDYIQTQIEKEKQKNEIDPTGTKVVEKNVTTPNTGEIISNTKENNQSELPEPQNPSVTSLLGVPPVPTPESPVPPASETSATLIATPENPAATASQTPAIILTPETSTTPPGIPPVTSETTAIPGTVNNHKPMQLSNGKAQVAKIRRRCQRLCNIQSPLQAHSGSKIWKT